MSRRISGEQAAAGFYFNCTSWEIVTLSGQGGILGGPAGSRFLRLPLPLLLVAAPMMGAAFAMFLPFIGIALVLDYAARRAWAAGREAMHATALALGPRTRTGEAYFTGDDQGQDERAADGETASRLAEIEREVERLEREGR